MTPIFYYHSIGDGPLSVSPADFRAHLQQIHRVGKRAVSVSELLAAPESGGLVGMTFDDCFQDVFDNAVPALREHDFTATFYAVPGYDRITLWGSLAAGRWSAHHGDGFDIPFTFMGPEQRRQLAALGMEIGCHTMTHPNLDTLSLERQRDEIVTAKQVLEIELGHPVRSFCYPRGRYNQDTLRLVSEAGFTSACTTQRGYLTAGTNFFEIMRFAVGGDAATFASILAGYGGQLPLAQRIRRKFIRGAGKLFEKPGGHEP